MPPGEQPRARRQAYGTSLEAHSKATRFYLISSSFSPPTTRPQQQVQSPSGGGKNQPPPCPADAASRRHQMVLKHHSIQESLYDESYGLGDCLDKPVVGGIAALETHYKSKWRNHFSASEKTFHSPRW
jgi:hypothetical protein